MINFFDNETENGKLYINYPMMESFKHFKSLPDYDYNNYEVSKDECLTYKKHVNNVSNINHFNDINERILSIIIKQNLNKYEFISNKTMKNYDNYLVNFSQAKLLDLQISHYKKYGKVYVFNTSVFWGIDYFGSNKYKEYIDYELKYENK